MRRWFWSSLERPLPVRWGSGRCRSAAGIVEERSVLTLRRVGKRGRGAACLMFARWLTEQGLEQYAPVFAENAIDDEILRTLSGDDLKELGVEALGHRKKLLAAIALAQRGPGNCASS